MAARVASMVARGATARCAAAARARGGARAGAGAGAGARRALRGAGATGAGAGAAGRLAGPRGRPFASGGDLGGGGGKIPPRVPKPPAAGGGGGGGGSGGIVGWYMGLLSAYPLATKTLTTGMLNLLGDAFAQTAIEKTESYDYKRSAIFFLLGVGFVGPALSLWYGALNKIITAQSAAGAMGRLALDQFVWAPVFIASFFAALLTCEGRPHEIQDKLRTDLKDAVLVNWKIWIPAQFINFRYTPPNLQVLFANGVALVWNTYLAWATHK